MRYDVVVNLETLSTGNKPVILQIGAVGFNIESGKILSKFEENIDLQASIDAGLEVDAKRINWWLNQNKQARESIFNNKNTKNLKEVLMDFRKWLYRACKYKPEQLNLWSNGSLSDDLWLSNAYKAVGLHYPVPDGKSRDTNTILNLANERSNIAVKNIEDLESYKNAKYGIQKAIIKARCINSCFNNLKSNIALDIDELNKKSR